MATHAGAAAGRNIMTTRRPQRRPKHIDSMADPQTLEPDPVDAHDTGEADRGDNTPDTHATDGATSPTLSTANTAAGRQLMQPAAK